MQNYKREISIFFQTRFDKISFSASISVIALPPLRLLLSNIFLYKIEREKLIKIAYKHCFYTDISLVGRKWFWNGVEKGGKTIGPMGALPRRPLPSIFHSAAMLYPRDSPVTVASIGCISIPLKFTYRLDAIAYLPFRGTQSALA